MQIQHDVLAENAEIDRIFVIQKNSNKNQKLTKLQKVMQIFIKQNRILTVIGLYILQWLLFVIKNRGKLKVHGYSTRNRSNLIFPYNRLTLTVKKGLLYACEII